MPPKSKLPKTSARSENLKEKLSALFEEWEQSKENAPRFSIQNIVHGFNKFQHGYIKPDQMKKFGELLISEKLKNFKLFNVNPCSFDRRVTALQCHPSIPYISAFGSKSGTLVVIFNQFTDTQKNNVILWDGIGPGGSITDICFDPFTPSSVFTSSIDGTVKIRNYNDRKESILLNTASFEEWYCSVRASHDFSLVLAGHTNGYIKILNKDLKLSGQFKLHKKKLNSIDFCKSRSWLFATSSLDKSVKIWDIRKIDPNNPLNTLQHVDPVNSAYFSKTNGNRLLTTDQQNEIRIYKGPLFDLESRIPHPHRQFQHLTPIKATWHPLCDLIVLGRYPHPNWPSFRTGELNTIDVISAETRETVVQISSVSATGIISLNAFNSTGEILASGMGMHVLFWKEKEVNDDKDIDMPDDDSDNSRPLPPKRKISKEKQFEKCPKSKLSKLRDK